jgi:MOSC domain-containing protein YiiM
MPTTGIDKLPVESIHVADPGPRDGVGGSGVRGDEVSDVRHHGGTRQAVYAYAREELEWWERELDRELRSGLFGENLTTTGFDVDESLVGERWVVGDVLLEVCGPRIPCRTFAGHLGERGWVKRFTQRGRTGAYLSVVTPGTITAGTSITRVDIPDHDITVPVLFRAYMGDKQEAARVLEADVLPEPYRAELVARLR